VASSETGLGVFNELSAEVALAELTTCLHGSQWAQTVLQGRPYPSVDALAERAMTAARQLSEQALADALAAHPRIGERPTGSGAAALFSRTEQAGVTGDDGTAAALRQANIDYEERFGRVFLIRAAGRGATDILAEAGRRLANDDAAEGAEVREQLGEIAVLRLRQVLGEP